MAYYENLPIYRRTMELAVFVEAMVRGFARYHKYALGADLRHLSRRLVALVIKANSRRDNLCSLVDRRTLPVGCLVWPFAKGVGRGFRSADFRSGC